jgi:hypothetical protein
MMKRNGEKLSVPAIVEYHIAGNHGTLLRDLSQGLFGCAGVFCSHTREVRQLAHKGEKTASQAAGCNQSRMKPTIFESNGTGLVKFTVAPSPDLHLTL